MADCARGRGWEKGVNGWVGVLDLEWMDWGLEWAYCFGLLLDQSSPRSTPAHHYTDSSPSPKTSVTRMSDHLNFPVVELTVFPAYAQRQLDSHERIKEHSRYPTR